MTKRTKKLIAGLLTAAMVIGTFTFVSAEPTTITEDSENYSASVSGNASTSTPKIKIEVPTDASFVVNPYKIQYESTDGTISGNDAIVSAKNVITNKSEVPVMVSVEGLVVDNGTYADKKYSSGITVMSGSARKAKNKSIYLFMRMASDKNTAVEDDETKVETFKIPEGDKPAKGSVKDIKATAKITTKGQPAAGGSLKNAIKLGAGTWDGDTYKEGGQAVEFTLMGDVNANPTKVEQKDGKNVTVADPWKATDDAKLKVSYKFTFEPQSLE